MRWLLLKDLRILRRSPLMVALLVIYPIVIAVLIGFALSRGPDKPKVAFYNGLSVSASTIELGGHKLNLADEEGALFKDVDVVKVDEPRRTSIKKVRDGDVLAGIVIPKDLAANLQSTLESGKLEVFYNSEDPAKQAFVENTIEAQVKAANAALTKRIAEEALRAAQPDRRRRRLPLPRPGLQRARAQALGGDPQGGARGAAAGRAQRSSTRCSTSPASRATTCRSRTTC